MCRSGVGHEDILNFCEGQLKVALLCRGMDMLERGLNHSLVMSLVFIYITMVSNKNKNK